MKFTTDYELENFILDTQWDDLPAEVKERMKGCLIDLMGALISGSKSKQFEVGLALARRVFRSGDVAVIGAGDRFDFLGAASAMSHASNAYDIDDGHNIIRAHPGTSFIGGVLAAAYEKDLSMKDFLTALYVSYEVTIRMGRAVMDYYQFAHSSGTFGAVGVAAGVGRIYGFCREELNNALSISEFNAPLVPAIRSVEHPSMNKDGVPFGVMIGALAVMDSMSGFTGNKNLLEAEEYRHYLNDLGEKHEVMNLYFKPYPCCRWAHPAIDACLSLLQEHAIVPENIASVRIYTFQRATQLSKGVPTCADEAQYNIAYPVASSLVNGGFSIAQVERTDDPAVIEMMKKLSFHCDPVLESAFPDRRLCRAEIELENGSVFCSEIHEPRGERTDHINCEWLSDKFCRTTEGILSAEKQKQILSALLSDGGTVRPLVDGVNARLLSKRREK